MKIEEFKKRSSERKDLRLDRFEHENQEEVKNEMMEEFRKITANEGRMIVNQAGVIFTRMGYRRCSGL